MFTPEGLPLKTLAVKAFQNPFRQSNNLLYSFDSYKLIRYIVCGPRPPRCRHPPKASCDPPQYRVEAKNYMYSPCPLLYYTPMPQDIFLHYLSCTAFNPTLAWLPRLPKKLNPGVLRYTGAINYGWGVHINEEPNYFALGVINIFLMIASGLATYL